MFCMPIFDISMPGYKSVQSVSQTLTDDLKSELSGKFEDAMVGLVMAPESYDAVALHDAMSVSSSNRNG